MVTIENLMVMGKGMTLLNYCKLPRLNELNGKVQVGAKFHYVGSRFQIECHGAICCELLKLSVYFDVLPICYS